MSRGIGIPLNPFRPLYGPAIWIADLLSEAVELLIRTLRPDTWSKQPVRVEFFRQCYHCGVQALPFVMVIAVVTGAGVIVQALNWLRQSASSDLSGPFVLGLLRESSAAVVALAVIVRGGSAMVAELATVRAVGQDRMLNAHGIDFFLFLVLPRALGMVVGAVCLSVCFVAVALVSGSIAMSMSTGISLTPEQLTNLMLEGLTLADALAFLLKPAIAAALGGLLACRLGLSVTHTITDVRRVLPTFVAQALTITALVSVFVTVLLGSLL